jgi:cleavage stimulation factor subunit 2
MPPQQQQSYAYVNGQQYYGVPAPRQAYGFQGYLYHEAQAAYPGYPSTYGAPQPPPQASQTPVLPDTLAAIPDDQKVHMTSFHLSVIFLMFLFSQGSYNAGPFGDT